ncbi:sulfotransferase family protein [Maritalea mobilis]|uniref:sulfotransferase family 2 domain-containing protein n=1 Tax=Maritalea mobilis TaxID=483324 RepID=UPI001C94517B|nr:sulfotransferase family 2 domain-containing protein [Maritalea mobilis]MBY6199737.1 sulfotransferase family protein [Maritalea mobilis]
MVNTTEAGMKEERTIILHYHLFKNAGTSVDAILKENFPGRWVTREFPMNGGNNTGMVEEWIRETPEAVAYSSHTMVGPIPQMDGIRVISFMLLRDPIERIKSAYRFERKQEADTWGARLAKEHDFEGYVRARLARPGDRQCRDFQTARLASLTPGPEPELARARKSLEALSVVGLVNDLSGAMDRLADLYFEHGEDFGQTDVRANTSSAGSGDTLSPDLVELLRENNANDLQLFDRMT